MLTTTRLHAQLIQNSHEMIDTVPELPGGIFSDKCRSLRVFCLNRASLAKLCIADPASSKHWSDLNLPVSIIWVKRCIKEFQYMFPALKISCIASIRVARVWASFFGPPVGNFMLYKWRIHFCSSNWRLSPMTVTLCLLISDNLWTRFEYFLMAVWVDFTGLSWIFRRGGQNGDRSIGFYIGNWLSLAVNREGTWSTPWMIQVTTMITDVESESIRRCQKESVSTLLVCSHVLGKGMTSYLHKSPSQRKEGLDIIHVFLFSMS